MPALILLSLQLQAIECALIGISLQGIKTFILDNYPEVDPNTLKVRVSKALEECLAKGQIRKPETSGENPKELDRPVGLGQFSQSLYTCIS